MSMFYFFQRRVCRLIVKKNNLNQTGRLIVCAGVMSFFKIFNAKIGKEINNMCDFSNLLMK